MRDWESLHHTRFLSDSAHLAGDAARVSAGVRFSIGGLAFDLSGQNVPLLQEIDQRYRPFLVGEEAPQAPDPFRLRFEVDPSPPCDGRVVFHSRATWSILAREGERLFVFRDVSEPEPLYTARFRPGSREVSVLCSPRLLRAVGSDRVLFSPFRYPLDQILAMYLLGEGGLIVHAAGLVFGGTGVALPGVSGAGKSTICALAAGRPGWAPLSDDRVIARLMGERAEVHGTPWPGEAGIAANGHSQLGALVFLEQGDTNEIRLLERREALGRLFRTASLPWFDEEYLERGLSACGGLVRTAPSALLTFRPDGGALDAVERLLATGPPAA